MNDETAHSEAVTNDASSVGDRGEPEASVLFALVRDAMLQTKVPVEWQPPDVEQLSLLLPGIDALTFIDRGGMAAVYRGVQRELGRVVAVKVLPQEMSEDESFTARFRTEAQAMARLNHPNIVTIYEFGTTAGGHLYFIMEFVDGQNLQDLLAAGDVSMDTALAIARQVCKALEYAHERGIIHRDIKPSNILVSKNTVVKVADFGLAKLVQDEDEWLGVQSHGHSIVGTPGYGSPEQLTNPGAVDQRSDIYSVGVVLYQLLTGRLPQSLPEMAPLQVPSLDPQCEAIIAEALHEQPEKRYQSIQILGRALDGITSQPAARQLPGSVLADRSTNTAKPRRAVLLGTLALGSLLLGGLVWHLWIEQPGAASTALGTSTPRLLFTALPPSAAPTLPAPTSALQKLNEAFLQSHVRGSTWRTQYSNDARYDTIEFDADGNTAQKSPQTRNHQPASWNVLSDGVTLRLDMTDTSGFYILLRFLNGTEAQIEFYRGRFPVILGRIMREGARAQAMPASPVAPRTAAAASGTSSPSSALDMNLFLEDRRDIAVAVMWTRYGRDTAIATVRPGPVRVDCSTMRDGVHMLNFRAEGYASQQREIEIVNGKPKAIPPIELFKSRYVIMRVAFAPTGKRGLTGSDLKETRVALPQFSAPEVLCSLDWEVRQNGEGGFKDAKYGKTPWLGFHHQYKKFGFVRAGETETYDSLHTAPVDGYSSEELRVVKGLLLYYRNTGNGTTDQGYGKLLVEDVTESPPTGVPVMSPRIK